MDSEDVKVEAVEGEDAPRPLLVRGAIGVGWTLASLLLLWGAVHLFIPPISPQHAPPTGHFGTPCWSCHLMTAAPPAKGK